MAEDGEKCSRPPAASGWQTTSFHLSIKNPPDNAHIAGFPTELYMEGWNPEDYAAHSAAQETWAHEMLPSLALNGSERLLDIGCGDGKITAALARQVPCGTVIGLDRSPAMITFAKSTHPTTLYRNLGFVEGEAAQLGFLHAFDVVFSNAALHWIPDQRPVLAGIARALAPGGRCLLQMGGKGNAADVFAVVADIIAEEPWRQYFTGFSSPYAFFDADEYTSWLSEAGLSVRSCRLFERIMRFSTPEGFAGWLRTTWHPYIDRVPGARREEFLAAIVAEYTRRHPPDGNGEIRVRMMRLEAAAEKPAA